MRPFNLGEYLKDPSKRVVTRNGRSVRIICTDRRNIKCPIVALIENECDEKICSYSKSGRFFYNDLSSFDLFFASEDDTEEPIITCDNIPLKWSYGKLIGEKFDPKTFQPFDKVLSKYYIDKEWTCGILSHPYCYSGFEGFIVNSNFVRYCIPYNEETKHLVGTTDDCPKYYKWWEE